MRRGMNYLTVRELDSIRRGGCCKVNYVAW